jgi:diguanylate cyclase (GGDEF)-like protein
MAEKTDMSTDAADVLELVGRVDRASTQVVARWLADSEGFADGGPQSLADIGALAGRVPPSALINAHLMWRGTTIDMLEDEARRGTTDAGLLAQARIVLTERCDAGLVAASRQFDDPRDRLTGLANRSLLLERMEHALHGAARYGDSVGVIFIELQPEEEDSDDLELEASERLRRVARASDTVARLGRHEFVICCERLPSELEAVAIADRALMALRQPYAFGGQDLHASATAGIAVSSGGDGPETLLASASAARHAALEQSDS